MATKHRDIRAARKARELARWMGHGTPLPASDEADEAGDDWAEAPPVTDNRKAAAPIDRRSDSPP